MTVTAVHVENYSNAPDGNVFLDWSTTNATYQNALGPTNELFSSSTAPSSFDKVPESETMVTYTATTRYAPTQIHDYQGIGSWTLDTNYEQSGNLPLSAGEAPLGCQYHAPILQATRAERHHTANCSPLDRFYGEGPSEQYAIFHRPDTGGLSTSRGCCCRQMVGDMPGLSLANDDQRVGQSVKRR
jgi:hypothetical protein